MVLPRPIRRFLPVLIFSANLVISAAASPKGGEVLDINADVFGVSGSEVLVSSAGFRISQTHGVPLGGKPLFSDSGLAISPGIWAATPVRPSGGRTVVVFGDPRHPAKLTVEPDAFPSDWILFAGTSPATSPLAVSAAAVQQAGRNLAQTLTRFTKPLDDQLWEILALDDNGAPIGSNLRSDASLSLPFRDEDQDGFVDNTSPPVRVSALSVWWLDEAHSLWVKLPNSKVDPSGQAVTAPIRHFSVFTVMGVPLFDPGNAYAFPVPWRPFGPNAGSGPGQTGNLAGGITFTNLPSVAKIRIYTLAGSLVRELIHDDGTAQRSWDVRNDAGEEVQSGTYLYVIESNDNRKTGKLVVIR